jgi:hypothetical protein
MRSREPNSSRRPGIIARVTQTIPHYPRLRLSVSIGPIRRLLILDEELTDTLLQGL